MVFTFSVLEWKYSFWQILSKTSKFPVSADVWYLKQFEFAECSCDVQFSYFQPGAPFLGKFGPKIKNFNFKLKFGSKTNSNMQNSMMMFSFSVLEQKCFSVFGKICSKNSKMSV